MAEARIEHRYPDAFAFLQAHGPDALAVLHDLLASAEIRDGQPVVRRSVRAIARDLFISKDTVHRRLVSLRHAGVLRAAPRSHGSATRAYVVDLAGTGIALTAVAPSPR